MGSPLSATISNIFMELFEHKFLSNIFNFPFLWLRYVDDDLVAMPNAVSPPNILNKLNCCVPTIKFTLELPSNGALPFLDVVVSTDENGTPTFKIFRKPTHLNGLSSLVFSSFLFH